MEYPRGKVGPRCHMESKGDVNKWELVEEVETPLVCTNILLLLHDFLSKAHSIQQVPSFSGKIYPSVHFWRSLATGGTADPSIATRGRAKDL